MIAWRIAAIVAHVAVAAAPAQVSITTRDGRTVRGALISETERGFLVSTGAETVMVPYADVASVDRGTGAPAAPTPTSASTASSDTRLALGIGAYGAPAISDKHQGGERFVAGAQLQAPIDFGGAKVSGRFIPRLVFATSGPGTWRRSIELQVAAELRLHFSESYAVGIGAFGGGAEGTSGVPGFSRDFGLYAVFGPQLTPMSIRFGANELELSAALVFAAANGHSGVDSLRPVLSYLREF